MERLPVEAEVEESAYVAAEMSALAAVGSPGTDLVRYMHVEVVYQLDSWGTRNLQEATYAAGEDEIRPGHQTEEGIDSYHILVVVAHTDASEGIRVTAVVEEEEQ